MPTCHPLLGSSLSALLLLGVIHTARSRNPIARPQTDADRQFVQCSTARTLLHQGRGEEALTLLKSNAHTPLPLAHETSLSNEISPGTRVLQLGMDLMHAAQSAEARGLESESRAYAEQCQILSRRIQVVARDEQSRHVAQLMKQLASRD